MHHMICHVISYLYKIHIFVHSFYNSNIYVMIMGSHDYHMFIMYIFVHVNILFLFPSNHLHSQINTSHDLSCDGCLFK